MKKSFVIIIIYLIFSIVFVLYNSSRKYIILSNDYMFEVGTKIKVIKKYPSFINNSKINYYNNTIKQVGYMNIKSKKLIIDQVNGNNIDFYTSDYKKIIGSNLVATYGIKDMDVLNIEKYIYDKIGDDDQKIIKEYLEKNGVDDFPIKYYRKYLVDINNDKINDSIYIISNKSLYLTEDDTSLDINSSINESDEYYQFGFVRTGNQNIKLFEINEDNSSGQKFYDLGNIFDINNDSMYELNFSIDDYNDYNYHCESIFRLENNRYVEYKNCVTEDD